jgi:class 3 adenylate cyclase/CHASE3 domain sensor protein
MKDWLSGLAARAPFLFLTKQNGTLIAIAVLLIIFVVVVVQILGGVNRRSEEIDSLRQKVAAFHQLQQDTTAQLYVLTSALLSPEKRRLESALRQLNQFRYDLDRIQFITKDESELFNKIQEAQEQLIQVITKVVELTQRHEFARARELRLNRIGPLADSLDRLMNEMVNRAEADMETKIDQSNSAYRTARWVITGFAVGSIGLAILLGYQFLSEEKRKRQLRATLIQYVSPSLVQDILKNPQKLVLGGEEKRLTVLFSDIRGFTTIAEGLKPQVLVKLMNDYLSPMTDIVFENGGTIDKYMGDAIMAFWGAPVWQEDHPQRACRTALRMISRVQELKPIWEAVGIDKFEIGIGLSTGNVTVGNMGSHARFGYTVMGDSVNLGSRLEGLNKEYGTSIIVPQFTYDDVKEEFSLRRLDRIKVKGKKVPTTVYELMGDKAEKEKLKAVIDGFENGLAAYMEQKWERAEMFFQAVLKVRPEDGPSKTFLARIQDLRQQALPPDWDGVFIMTRK